MAKLKQAPPLVAASAPTIRSAPKLVDEFYRSPEWLALVASIKRERGNVCQDCGADGRKVRLFADHITEIRDGGAKLDRRNIRMRCGRCHGRKTEAERRKRAAGQT